MASSPTQLELYIKLNGGAPQTGIVAAAYADSCVLSVGSTGTGAKRVKYRIRSFPPGYAVPAGWTAEGKFYVATVANGADSPAIALPSALSALWGKYIFDATRDGQIYNGRIVSEYFAKARLKIASVTGVDTVAYLEEEEFHATRGYVDAIDSLARRYEEGMPGTGDVSGPAGSTAGNLPAFNGISGLSLQDSGKPAASVVLGPSSVPAARIPIYDGPTGKLLADSGVSVFDIGQSFNVRSYGASPAASAATNNAAFIAAITAAMAVGGTVVVPEGTYAINPITLTGGGAWNLDLRSGATLDFSAASVGDGLSCITLGQDSDFVELSAPSVDIDKHDTTVTFPAPPDLATGDLFIVCDDDDFSWDDGDPARPFYKKGDFLRVRAVSGSIVTVDKPIADSYPTAANIRAIKLLVNRVNIYGGGTIITPTVFADVSGGIQIWNGYKCQVDDLVVEGNKWGAVNFYRCYESEIWRLRVLNYEPNVDRNYGVIMASCYACHVRNSWIRVGRHAVTITGGAMTGTHPNRLCTVNGGTYQGDLIALDMHGACEHCAFENLECDGGMNVAGDHWAVRNSTILDCPHPTDFTGVALRVREDKGTNGTIENVTLVARYVATGDDSLLSLLYGAPERGGTITVKDLRMITGDLAISQVAKIDLGGASGGRVSVDLDGVTCVSELDAAPQFTVSCHSSAKYDQVSLRNTKGMAPRVATVSARLVTIDGVEVYAAGAAGVLVQLAAYPGGGQQQRVDIRNVVALRSGTQGINLAGPGSGEDIIVSVSNCTSVNNGVGGGSSAGRCSVAATGIKTVSVIGNTLGDTQGTQTQAFQAVVTSCGTLRIWGNNQEGVRLVDSIGTTGTLLTSRDMVANVISEDVASAAQTAPLEIAVLASTSSKYIVDVEAEDASGDRASLRALVRVARSGSGVPPTPDTTIMQSTGTTITLAATISGTSLRLRTTNGMGADAHITTQVREDFKIFTVEDS